MTAPSGPKVGRNIAIVDPSDWSSTFHPTPGLRRPLDAKFGPDGALYVVDFGHFEPARGSMEATAGSGGLLRCEWPPPAN
jgi:hypothetical protein